MYLRHLLKERRADPAFASLTQLQLARGAVRDHQRLYGQLARARKPALKAEVFQHARDAVVATADEADLLSARLDLHNLRRSQEREQVGIINHMDSFRMTDADVVGMCDIFDGIVQGRGVAALMRRQAVALVHLPLISKRFSSTRSARSSGPLATPLVVPLCLQLPRAFLILRRFAVRKMELLPLPT